MKVKIFKADNMQDAINQVKLALGRDAIILHVKKYNEGGFFGKFGKEKLEVVAGIEETPPIKSLPVMEPLSIMNRESIKTTIPKRNTKETNNLREINSKENNNLREINSKIVYNGMGDFQKEQSKEVRDLKEEITKLAALVEKAVNKPNDYYKEDKSIVNTVNTVEEYLRGKDLSNEIIEQIVQRIKIKNLSLDIKNSSVQNIIKVFLEKLLIKMTTNNSLKRHIVFIGPTGVGKTTTLAKMAAQFIFEEQKNVAFVTADTYRIAAVDQVKTYADILNAKLKIVYSSEDMKMALTNFADKDYVFIDTAGRSQYNSVHISELKNLLEAFSDIESYLVISATTSSSEAIKIVENFSVCNPKNIIFTKTDETSNISVIFNVAYRFPNISLAYITNGQAVPDDIEVANPSKMVDSLVGDLNAS